MYRATYKQKRVIKLAPDAVIRVNGDFKITICPVCKAQINLSDYVTSLSTSLPINSTIGNAQFTIAMPRHGSEGNYMVRGGRVYGLELMDEIEVFIKGRYPTDQNDEYPYYKVFWGVVTNIGESYNAGVQEISVSCESMLKWFQLMRTNVHPAIMHAGDSTGEANGKNVNFWSGNNFANLTPYEIIYKLTEVTMLNMVIPATHDTEKKPETPKDKKGNDFDKVNKYWGGENGKKIKNTVIADWQKKFESIRSALKMFGTTSESFVEKKDSNYVDTKNKAITDKAQAMASATKATTAASIHINSKALMDFKPFAFKSEDTSLSMISSNYKTNLELINEVRTYTAYEFYQDTNGDIVFKPPFWNLDTEPNNVYKIKDSDIVSWDFQESEDSVVTRVEVKGQINLSKQIAVDAGFTSMGIFTNYALTRKFGLRTHPLSSQVLSTPHLCYHHAINEMDRINANIYRGSLTIVGRPELRLGYPVYIESRDMYGYIENISHNFAFGGPFTTQIHLTSIRKKYLGNDTMSEGYAFNTDSDKKLKGDAVVLVYVGPDDTVISDDIKDKVNQPVADHNQVPYERRPKGGLKTNRAGSYKEISLKDKKAQGLLQQLDIAKQSGNTNAYLKFLDKAIPVSDESGYELIGIFEYGRSMYLDSNGTIKKKAGSFGQLLSKSINKASKFNDIQGGGASVYQHNPDKTTMLDGNSKEINKAANTEKGVSDFQSQKSFKLASIAPGRDKALSPGCSCFDGELTNIPYQSKTPSNKQKPIKSTRK